MIITETQPVICKHMNTYWYCIFYLTENKHFYNKSCNLALKINSRNLALNITHATSLWIKKITQPLIKNGPHVGCFLTAWGGKVRGWAEMHHNCISAPSPLAQNMIFRMSTGTIWGAGTKWRLFNDDLHYTCSSTDACALAQLRSFDIWHNIHMHLFLTVCFTAPVHHI